MNKRIIECLTIFLILLLLASCTSLLQGSLFNETSSSYIKNEPDNKSTTTPEPSLGEPQATAAPTAAKNTLLVSTTPGGATVYLNNSFRGASPVTFTDLKPGTYKITVTKEGYYAETLWIDYYGGNKEYNIILKEITGFLVVHINVPNAEITVGNSFYSHSPMELRIGNYTVKARAFGYDEYTENISIYENYTTEVDIFLQEAAFALSDPRLSRPVFSPDNPGPLGTTTLFFRVTGYGKGTFKVENSAGEAVFREDLPRFTTWDQAYTWNGKGTSNSILEDGSYTLTIEATGEKDGLNAVLTASLRIDRSYVITFRIPWSGLSGLIYTATPDILPSLSFQLSAHALLTPGFFIPGNSMPVALFNTGIRLGLPGKGELNINYSPVLVEDSEIVPFTVTGGWKQQLFSTGSGSRGFKGVITARGTYVYATNADTYTNYTGFTLGLPVAFNSGIVSVIVNPELTISPYRVIYGTSAAQVPAPQMWLYGKAGIVVDAGTIIAGLSGSMRSLSLNDGWGINYPVNAGLEVNMLIPGTALYFSADAAMEFISTADYYINLGIGLSLLY